MKHVYRHPHDGVGSLYFDNFVLQLNRRSWRFALFLEPFAWDVTFGDIHDGTFMRWGVKATVDHRIPYYQPAAEKVPA